MKKFILIMVSLFTIFLIGQTPSYKPEIADLKADTLKRIYWIERGSIPRKYFGMVEKDSLNRIVVVIIENKKVGGEMQYIETQMIFDSFLDFVNYAEIMFGF